jgi:hypothetical protein
VPGCYSLIAGEFVERKLYQFVSKLAADGTSIAVACWGLKLALQPHYRWLVNPVGESELIEAYQVNALFNAYVSPRMQARFLTDEARDGGQLMTRRTVWRIRSANGWFSVFSKKHRVNMHSLRSAGA